ncbi:SH3 and PX domain-containing protein 2A-like isoform X2 [Glandiceps talaboti]
MARTIIEVKVVDAEKRRFPSKHYVYVIHVHWSDNTSHVIYRRYSRFFDFQIRLLEMFPEEAGTRDPAIRSIPFLPGKKILSRSNIRKVAMERLVAIDQYCQTLISLPAKISECPVVHAFFETLPDDVNPSDTPNQDASKIRKDSEVMISDPVQLQNYVAIADYKKQKRNELNLQGGDIVEVIEKNHTGWWFVSLEDEQGWVPATFLQMVDDDNDDDFKNVDTSAAPERFVSISPYTAQNSDEISFDKGVVVDVVKKNLDGWWFIRYQSKEGWAPATYLHEVYKENKIEAKQPVEMIGNVMDISKPKQPTNVETKKTVPSSQLDVPAIEPVTANRSPLFRHKPPPRRGTVKKTHSGKGSIKEKPDYYTIADFDAMMEDGVSFKKGQKVKVMEKAEGGWWYVNIDNKEGWAPSNFIEKRSPNKPQPAARNISTADTQPVRPLTPSKQIQTAKPVLPTVVETKPTPPSKPDVLSKPNKPLPAKRPGVTNQASKPIGGNITNELQQAFAALKPVNEEMNVYDEIGTAADERPKMAFKPRVPSTRPVLPPTPLPSKPHRGPPRPPPPNIKSSNPNLYTVLADYSANEEGTLTLNEGMKVEVIEKDDNGWWLVQTTDNIQGWAPTSYLAKEP